MKLSLAQFLVWPCVVVAMMVLSSQVLAQTPPSQSDIGAYEGLHAAAHEGDTEAVRRLAAEGADLEARDESGRTPLHVAAFASHEEVVQALAQAGAEMNALEDSRYDIVTIAAVADDLEMLDRALSLGTNAGNVTSLYDGTALIAAAHLGHHEVVSHLIAAGAPLDHINNLGWTALIEAVILGDGGSDHIETVRVLVNAGADRSISDRRGTTPLQHALARGFGEIADLLR